VTSGVTDCLLQSYRLRQLLLFRRPQPCHCASMVCYRYVLTDTLRPVTSRCSNAARVTSSACTRGMTTFVAAWDRRHADCNRKRMCIYRLLVTSILDSNSSSNGRSLCLEVFEGQSRGLRSTDSTQQLATYERHHEESHGLSSSFR